MKYFKIIIVIVAAVMTAPLYAGQLSPAENANDSTLRAIKVQELTKRKAELKKLVEAADRKRNMSEQGVSPETQEMMNDRQDSICLELRSQLTAVELELEEVSPNKAVVSVVNRLNSLSQQQQPAKPQPGNDTTAVKPEGNKPQKTGKTGKK